MKKNNIRIIISLIALIVLVGLVYVFRLSIRADVIPSPAPSLSSDTLTIIKGKVFSKDHQPLVGIDVIIGGVGVVSGSDGSYRLNVTTSGSVPVRFYDENKNQTYQLANTFEQAVDMTAGQANNVDFTIEPVTGN